MKLDYCHVCGGGLQEKQSEVYECNNCGTELDLSVFEDSGETLMVKENDNDSKTNNRIEIDIDTLPF